MTGALARISNNHFPETTSVDTDHQGPRRRLEIVAPALCFRDPMPRGSQHHLRWRVPWAGPGPCTFLFPWSRWSVSRHAVRGGSGLDPHRMHTTWRDVEVFLTTGLSIIGPRLVDSSQISGQLFLARRRPPAGSLKRGRLGSIQPSVVGVVHSTNGGYTGAKRPK